MEKRNKQKTNKQNKERKKKTNKTKTEQTTKQIIFSYVVRLLLKTQSCIKSLWIHEGAATKDCSEEGNRFLERSLAELGAFPLRGIIHLVEHTLNLSGSGLDPDTVGRAAVQASSKLWYLQHFSCCLLLLLDVRLIILLGDGIFQDISKPGEELLDVFHDLLIVGLVLQEILHLGSDDKDRCMHGRGNGPHPVIIAEQAAVNGWPISLLRKAHTTWIHCRQQLASDVVADAVHPRLEGGGDIARVRRIDLMSMSKEDGLGCWRSKVAVNWNVRLKCEATVPGIPLWQKVCKRRHSPWKKSNPTRKAQGDTRTT
eukprot:m.42825 g.42825  ORF g.42825 m.42825 type:complete len:313 (-) comp11978_c0_seq1:787-1725(-)